MLFELHIYLIVLQYYLIIIMKFSEWFYLIRIPMIFFSLVCKPLLNAYNSLYMPSKIDGGDFQKFQSLQ